MKENINFHEYREFAFLGSIIAVVLLLIAIPDFLPYGYYQLLRLFIMLIAIFLSTMFNTRGVNKALAIIFLLIAVLFNAFFPIHLDKGLWVIIDLVSAVMFTCAAFTLRK